MSQIVVKNQPPVLNAWLKKEDSWAMIIALGLIFLTTIAFFAGGSGFFKIMAVTVPGWSAAGKLTAGLGENLADLIYLYLFFAVVLSIGAQVMGYRGKRLAVGFAAAGFPGR
ncbi:putative membrane protein [Propionispora sp. 2/2-37]|uniref:hypothetical protein n=1 Tax=Propionispora sp. 2/2-37 TaxID=1677858 RepID=UPI0006BB8381|nr:hypothetical protein [Propionispora sp. 2/2-37]CUH97023.1 putative membrane protein [Propionispora sp. 2/2-37]